LFIAKELAKIIYSGPKHPKGGLGWRHKFGNSLLMKIELDEIIWE
jgi:hypothetical protein